MPHFLSVLCSIVANWTQRARIGVTGEKGSVDLNSDSQLVEPFEVGSSTLSTFSARGPLLIRCLLVRTINSPPIPLKLSEINLTTTTCILLSEVSGSLSRHI